MIFPHSFLSQLDTIYTQQILVSPKANRFFSDLTLLSNFFFVQNILLSLALSLLANR